MILSVPAVIMFALVIVLLVLSSFGALIFAENRK